MSQRKPPQEQIDYILNLFKSNQIQQALDFIDSLDGQLLSDNKRLS